MMLTVDSITGGNRERDKRTGFAIPFRLNAASIMQFAMKPAWAINYLTDEKFTLPQLDSHVDMGGGIMSISRYFTDMLDPEMNWDDVAEMVRHWNGQFCLKGIMTIEDARRAVDIGCTGIVVSNHGGRQLDGSRSGFDQLAEIVDAVGDKIDVIVDGGVQRGTHVLKALSRSEEHTSELQSLMRISYAVFCLKKNKKKEKNDIKITDVSKIHKGKHKQKH